MSHKACKSSNKNGFCEENTGSVMGSSFPLEFAG